jgi:hypothetical protein
MSVNPKPLGMSPSERLARYRHAAKSLALLSDRQLSQRLDDTALIGSGIGGTSLSVTVEGVPVFVKRIPLTDLERRPENYLSTANLFHLPTYYQYGVGSTGFGVWREVAAHTMTTSWVVSRQSESFPLMYHWRVIEGPPPTRATPEQQADIERTVTYWNGSTEVLDRLEAITTSSASVVLFLEHFPYSLHEWLTLDGIDGGMPTEAALMTVEQHMRSGVSFMNAKGLLHFDAHFRNILTDGRRLYFSDFGLATASSFDLSDAEIEFFATNITHDACYSVTQLVNWLATSLTADGDRNPWDRNAFIQRCAEGDNPAQIAAREVAAPVAAIIKRYAPIATVMNDFYWKLHGESRTTPYPLDAIRRVCGHASGTGTS